MKKLVKCALTVSGALAVPALVNYFIFNAAEKKSAQHKIENSYSWVGGNKINYIKSGNGKPLLLVHDIRTGNSMLEWEKNISMLSRHYTVYAIDMLGFGFSDKPSAPYSAYLYARLINDFIENVIGQKAYVVASSHSASIALSAACLDDRLIEKLMLISPTGAGTSEKTPQNIDSLIKKLLESPLLGTTFYNIISSRLYLAWESKKGRFFNSKYINLNYINKLHYSAHTGGFNAKLPVAALKTGFLFADIERLISKVSIPVHVIWGGTNYQNPVKNYSFLEINNPNISITVFDNTKLLPHYENEKGFYKECRSFF